MKEALAILLLALGYVAVEIIVGTAIGLILGAIMIRYAERDLRRDFLP